MAGILAGLASVALPAIASTLGSSLTSKIIPWIGKKVAKLGTDAVIPQMLRGASKIIPDIVADRFKNISKEVVSKAVGSGAGTLTKAGVEDIIQRFKKKPLGDADDLFGTPQREFHTLQLLDMLNRTRNNYNPLGLMYQDTSRRERRDISRIKGASELYRQLDNVTKQRNQIAIDDSNRELANNAFNQY